MATMFQAGHSPPCITAAERKRDSAQPQARRGGRAIKKISRSSADREAGVVFRWMQKENHPGCVRFGCCATFLDDAATPPCGDARRGVACSKHGGYFFTASPKG